MTELVQREYDGKWVMWQKWSSIEESANSWHIIGVYDALVDVEYS